MTLVFREKWLNIFYFLKYVAKHPSKPSFHAIQLDNEELITNIFWVDAKMIINYAHFGNNFGFDTTFGTNKNLGL